MAEYRRPFAEPGEGRRPTLTWPREIPIEGEPADVTAIATEYADWLGTSDVPKLFLKAEPGAILANERLVNLVRGWPALTEKTVAGVHFVQEDSPDEIGRAVAGWMGTLADRAPRKAAMSEEQQDDGERCDGGARPWRLGRRVELGEGDRGRSRRAASKRSPRLCR